MRYLFVPKNGVTITEAMQAHVKKKVDHISKYIEIPESATCSVVVKIYDTEQKVELAIPTIGLRAEASHKDFYGAVNLAVDKLEGQIRKIKTKADKERTLPVLEFAQEHSIQPIEVWLTGLEFPDNQESCTVHIDFDNIEYIEFNVDNNDDVMFQICGEWLDILKEFGGVSDQNIVDMYIL